MIRSNRLLFEPLERRGMLSATVGSLLDAVISEGVAESGDPAVDCDTSAEQVSEVDIDSAALPGGVSLLVCPNLDWVGSISGEISPNPTQEGADESGDSGSLLDGIVGAEGLLACIGYPALPTDWSLASDFPVDVTDDGVAPPDVELPPDDPVAGGIDPVIIVDPVVVDPQPVDPTDITDPIAPPDVELPPDDPVDGGIDPVIIVDPVVVDPQPVDPADITDPVAPPDTDLPPDGSDTGDAVVVVDPVIAQIPVWLYDSVTPICVMPLPVAVPDPDGGTTDGSSGLHMRSERDTPVGTMSPLPESTVVDALAEAEQCVSPVSVSQDATANPAQTSGGEPAAQRSSDLAAAGVWLGNQARGDADGMTPPVGRRRTR